MERVSCKVFFTVLWRGVCRVLGWFFGLFGYKRDGKFAKCVWGLFSISAALVMSVFALAAVYSAWNHFACEYRYQTYHERNDGEYVSNFIGFVKDYDGDNGYLVNKETGERVLEGIEWIAAPLGNDSLVCYSDGKLRGYFSKYTGNVIIQPRFKHAWVFSDGMASVVENGAVKFIDCTGKVVVDKNIMYDGYKSGYVFHGGYCVLLSEDGKKAGMMDKTGKMVLPMEYDWICHRKDYAFWAATKNDTATVYDRELNQVFATVGSITLTNASIDVTLPDHTICKYDYDGKLIHDFFVNSVRTLIYETDDIYYSENRYVDDEGNERVYVAEQRKNAVAKLRVYSVNGYDGLLTADGRVVTMPLYEDISAIGYDTYLCTVNTYDNVIVNGKGEIIK
ncbi:MAG: WG repeat-containing protein [Clostridium sp.]|nr:WG repeat-containing protein [Clostridium sp.]